jgi:hypothetical protein
MRRSSEYLEEGYGVSYRVQNLTVSKIGYQHFFKTELHLRIFDESLAELSEPDTTSTSIGNTYTCTSQIDAVEKCSYRGELEKCDRDWTVE